MSAILLDTRYLISLADPARAHHLTAVSYLREALKRSVPLYLSAVAASEFQVKQPVTDLPLRNFEVLAAFQHRPCHDGGFADAEPPARRQ
ncbi:hypothetical protein [Variovorax sp. UMC13]|uniref:hypothetical protein n=1 Tax=Variovorax sp. UMC13 TaxID=1862326 RepID=UPI001C7F08DE|nr:hypothetical protein [Variovorax sp. UMC13]